MNQAIMSITPLRSQTSYSRSDHTGLAMSTSKASVWDYHTSYSKSHSDSQSKSFPNTDIKYSISQPNTRHQRRIP